MSSLPYINFYFSDFLAGVSRLSPIERGVYISILASIYENDGPVNGDYDRLARVCGCDKRTLKKALGYLIDQDKITIDDDGMLSNERAEIELIRRKNVSAQASEKARRRWHGDGKKSNKINDSDVPVHTDSICTDVCTDDAIQNQNQIDASLRSASNAREDENNDLFETKKPAKPPPSKAKKTNRFSIADFENWYQQYPNKVGKPNAQKAFLAAGKKTDVTLGQLRQGVQNYINTKPPDRSWCNPATWLNQERWNDEPAGQTRANGINPAAKGQTSNAIVSGVAAALAERRRERGESEDLHSRGLYDGATTIDGEVIRSSDRRGFNPRS